MICPNCKKENKNTNIRCNFCSTELIDKNEFNQQDVFLNDEKNQIIIPVRAINWIANTFIILFTMSLLFVGIAGSGFSIFLAIIEHNQTKGYEETTAILDNYCIYEGESITCEEKYKYTVNNKVYYTPTNVEGEAEENVTIYYNPKDPNESVVHYDYTLAISNVFVVIIIIIILFILKKYCIRYISKGKDHIVIIRSENSKQE